MVSFSAKRQCPSLRVPFIEKRTVNKQNKQLSKPFSTLHEEPILVSLQLETNKLRHLEMAAAAAKSLQSCPTLCDPIDGSPPGSPVPGILQARTLELVAISFSNHESEKWKWSRSVKSDPQRPHGLQPSRLLHPWDFPGKSTGVGCHCLLREMAGNKEKV